MLHSSYDLDEDILYLRRLDNDDNKQVIPDEFDILWGYDEEKQIIGCTIFNFMEYWMKNNLELLTTTLSSQFKIPETLIKDLLQQQLIPLKD